MIAHALLGIALFAPKAGQAEAPVLVVERNQVVWPEKCEGGAVPEGVAERIAGKLGKESELVFVGNGRVADVTLGEAACMQAECGTTQVGVALATGGDADAAGVIVTKRLLGKATAHALDFVALEGSDPYGDGRLVAGKLTSLPPCGDAPEVSLPEGAERVAECRGYRVDAGVHAVQVQGAGLLQEDQYPLYKTARFRTLEKKGQEWKPGPWIALARGAEVTRLPKPVGVIAPSKGSSRVLWLRQIGICCPSTSAAWVTDVASKKDGALHEAGFGQPCD